MATQLTRQVILQAVIIGSVLGFSLSVLLMVFVIQTGSTFSQRCTKLYNDGSLEWNQCVRDLSKGKRLE